MPPVRSNEPLCKERVAGARTPLRLGRPSAARLPAGAWLDRFHGSDAAAVKHIGRKIHPSPISIRRPSKAQDRIMPVSTSDDRPDIVLFKGSTLFHSRELLNPSSLWSLNGRRGRPTTRRRTRLAKSIPTSDRFVAKTCKTRQEPLSPRLTLQTPFFCYVIADITPKLEQVLIEQQINKPLPGGRGFF